ncbi:MAG: hypothetical protein RIS47_530 [Bacteroidota bacterium]|jgi:CDGSH-type Zn-finger protein
MEDQDKKLRVEIRPNGSLKLFGEFTLVLADGSTQTRDYASFCRCGLSKAMPFCDGYHKEVGWVEPQPEVPSTLKNKNKGIIPQTDQKNPEL